MYAATLTDGFCSSSPQKRKRFTVSREVSPELSPAQNFFGGTMYRSQSNNNKWYAGGSR